jgi:hypothetical protein
MCGDRGEPRTAVRGCECGMTPAASLPCTRALPYPARPLCDFVARALARDLSGESGVSGVFFTTEATEITEVSGRCAWRQSGVFSACSGVAF